MPTPARPVPLYPSEVEDMVKYAARDALTYTLGPILSPDTVTMIADKVAFMAAIAVARRMMEEENEA